MCFQNLALLTVFLGLCSGQIFLKPASAQSTSILREQGQIDSSDRRLNDDSLYDLYTFSGDAGQQVVITLESSDFDTYLFLVDTNGNEVAENDDYDGTSNSRITTTLPVSSEYRVIVNSYDVSGRGQYILDIATVSTTSPALTSSTSQDVTEYIGVDYLGGSTSTLPGNLRFRGGWLVYANTPEEQFNHGVSVVLRDNDALIFFEEIIERRGSNITWRIMDAISVSGNGLIDFDPQGELNLAHHCHINGNQIDMAIFAIIKLEDAEYYTDVRQAWRANRGTGKIEEISSQGIACENPGWGV